MVTYKLQHWIIISLLKTLSFTDKKEAIKIFQFLLQLPNIDKLILHFDSEKWCKLISFEDSEPFEIEEVDN